MELLISINLGIHIACGTLALVAGFVPIITQKGSNIHKRSGKVFVGAMYGVMLTAWTMVLLRPYAHHLFFLAFIGLLSFYLTYMGDQAIRLYRGTRGYHILATQTLCLVGLGASLLMLGIGAWYLSWGGVQLGVLYIFFGILLANTSLEDTRVYWSTQPTTRKEYLLLHIKRILGAYVATITAFAVVNGHLLPIPPILVWILPGVIGGVLIRRWVRYYRLKGQSQ